MTPGLEECTARTFAGDAHAPLTEDLRSALLALFQMRWPGVESELSPEDWAEYQRLLPARVTGLYPGPSRLLCLLYLFDVSGPRRQAKCRQASKPAAGMTELTCNFLEACPER